MITPKELRDKADKLFFKVSISHLKGEILFPLRIPSNKEITGSNFSEWKADIIPLHQQSKAEKGKGYSVVWKEKKIGGIKQQVPQSIYFDGLEDYLFFINRQQDFEKIVRANELLTNRFPELKEWGNSNPAVLLDNDGKWDDLVKICDYFATNQPPHPYYLRELPIEIHSKFIEQNVAVIRKLLDTILPETAINKADNEFSARYYLKRINVFTQIRILDEKLKSTLRYDECALSLEDAAWLDWLPEKVFIIENKACFLSFPKVTNAVAIFGEGFKSRLSKDIPWLDKTSLYCWFDMDAAGFEMLNMIRSHHKHAKSFLMDLETYEKFKDFSVVNSYRQKELPFLSLEENSLYRSLIQNKRRLEQERISQQYLVDQLK